DLVVYDLEKRDDIVTQRDNVTNFTQRVNAGRTRHRGVELGAGVPFARVWRLDAAWSWSSQTYEEFLTSQGDFSGKHIEAAPRVLGNTRLTWLPRDPARLQLRGGGGGASTGWTRRTPPSTAATMCSTCVRTGRFRRGLRFRPAS